jgi:4-hydroxybenzoate polyprenyltransferase
MFSMTSSIFRQIELIPGTDFVPLLPEQCRSGLAFYLFPSLFLGSFSLSAWLLPPNFIGILVGYALLTSIYSLQIKQVAVADVILLAALYSFRVIAGGTATGIIVSAWLTAFSLFFFFSMAVMKRYTELSLLRPLESLTASGRSYSSGDQKWLGSIGAVSAYLPVLVMALYINSQDVMALYRRPRILWLVCPFLLYWITRLWFLAHRGKIDDDPLVFTFRDPLSYGLGAAIALTLVAAV